MITLQAHIGVLSEATSTTASTLCCTRTQQCDSVHWSAYSVGSRWPCSTPGRLRSGSSLCWWSSCSSCMSRCARCQPTHGRPGDGLTSSQSAMAGHRCSPSPLPAPRRPFLSSVSLHSGPCLRGEARHAGKPVLAHRQGEPRAAVPLWRAAAQVDIGRFCGPCHPSRDHDTCAQVVGLLVLLAAGQADGETLKQGIVGDEHIEPYNIVIIFMSQARRVSACHSC